jgi:plasmid stabilization system protein ParE
MTVRVLDSAKRHLIDGFYFYELQAPGLGNYFLDSLFADIDSLALYGGIHSQVHGFHRSVAKRFPFAIYYLFAGEEVRVYAVLDCRRNPSWIRHKLRQL